MSTTGERLKALIKYYRKTQEEFAQSIGNSKGYISLIVNDHEPITMGVLEKIIKSYPMVNLNWLVLGEGDMLRKEDEEKMDVVDEPEVQYRPVNWAQELSDLLDRHEERIARLEEEVQRLREEIQSK